MDTTIDTFPAGTLRVEQTVPSDFKRVNRRRIISHSVALLADKILSLENAEPEGLVITVHESTNAVGRPILVLTATTPSLSQPVLTP